jgi:polyisoprenoid-binding protein YceI
MKERHMATSEADLHTLVKDASLVGDWALDVSRSTIGLRSKSMWGLVSVKGAFREFSGKGAVSPDGEVTGTITVASASVDTKNAKRDTHLRSDDFFSSDAYRDITFTVDGVRPSGDGVTVSGTLKVRDRTKPLSFRATASVADDGEVSLDAQVPVNRADFGLTWNQMNMASMENTITIHAVFTRG